jgi:S1-C subfamily serine protease
VQTSEAEDGSKGLVVVRVYDDSVAAKSGLKEGDKILSFDGKDTNDVGALTESIRAAKGKVKLVVVRDGAEKTLEADFGAPKKRWF